MMHKLNRKSESDKRYETTLKWVILESMSFIGMAGVIRKRQNRLRLAREADNFPNGEEKIVRTCNECMVISDGHKNC